MVSESSASETLAISSDKKSKVAIYTTHNPRFEVMAVAQLNMFHRVQVVATPGQPERTYNLYIT